MDVNDPQAYKNLASGDKKHPLNANAPGIVTIPVCSIDEAYGNWQQSSRHPDNPNYPCNKLED